MSKLTVACLCGSQAVPRSTSGILFSDTQKSLWFQFLTQVQVPLHSQSQVLDPLEPSCSQFRAEAQHFKRPLKRKKLERREIPELCSPESSLWPRVRACICLWTDGLFTLILFVKHIAQGRTREHSTCSSTRHRKTTSSSGKHTLGALYPLPSAHPTYHLHSSDLQILAGYSFFFVDFIYLRVKNGPENTDLKLLLLKLSVYTMDFVKRCTVTWQVQFLGTTKAWVSGKFSSSKFLSGNGTYVLRSPPHKAVLKKHRFSLYSLFVL